MTTAQQLDAKQREALFGLWLDSQRYQQGVLDKHDIDDQQFEADWRQTFDRWLTDPINLCIVTLRDDVPVAYLRARLLADPAKHGAYIDDLFVVPAWRQRGLAQQLITEAKQWVTEHGASVLKLSVARQNAPAISLYEAVGFHEVPSEYLDYALPLD